MYFKKKNFFWRKLNRCSCFRFPGIKMQCSNSNSNSSGGGLIDRKPSYFGHPAGSVTLSSLSSLSSLNLSNIGGLSSGLSISNIPGTVSSNIHHATTTPSTTMYYDPIKYSMSNVWSGTREGKTYWEKCNAMNLTIFSSKEELCSWIESKCEC